MRNPLSKKVLGIKPSGIRKFFDIVNTLEGAISLGVGEPDFDTPYFIREEGIYSLEKGKTFYTSNSGLTELRTEISNYLKRKLDVVYNPNKEVIVTVGGSEGIDIALRAMVDTDDEVLIPQPSYVSYEPCAILAGAKPVIIELKEDNGFKLTKEQLLEKITDKTAKNIDFGLINGKTVFLSSYAGGLFTKISYNTDKALKKTFGKVAYYINGLGELTNIKTFDLEIVLDGNETIKEKAILYAILNGKSVGGFENVIDEASMNDGFMDILIVKNIDNPLDIPKILIDLMNSNLTNNDYIRTLQAKKCKIKKVTEEIDVSIDGEEGENIDVTIEFISGKLKVFC